MAEATGLRNSSLPYPVYGSPFGVAFPILDADGDLVTGATGLDSERSLNGDAFADCTNEATEIATNSGVYYLLLTAAEMTADVVSVIVKTSSSGAKTTTLTFYPRKLVTIRSGTAASGGSATNTIVLDSGASAEDDFYNGMICIATIDGNVEVRVISDYTGSSKTASVVPDWNVAPDSDDTFVIKLPEGWQLHQANVTQWSNSAVASPATAGYPVVTHKVGTGTGEINLSSGKAPATIAAGDIATDSITAAAVKADAVTKIQNGLATSAEVATVAGYIDTEIAAILSAVDTEVAAIKAKTDQLSFISDRVRSIAF